MFLKKSGFQQGDFLEKSIVGSLCPSIWLDVFAWGNFSVSWRVVSLGFFRCTGRASHGSCLFGSGF
ncbi:MAG TPA: hypothetical protein DCW68_00715 [Rhodospirillaceae bacterium]|nr:hypothetical protein [Rhodospirillaceae bacterium]